MSSSLPLFPLCWLSRNQLACFKLYGKRTSLASASLSIRYHLVHKASRKSSVQVWHAFLDCLLKYSSETHGGISLVHFMPSSWNWSLNEVHHSAFPICLHNRPSSFLKACPDRKLLRNLCFDGSSKYQRLDGGNLWAQWVAHSVFSPYYCNLDFKNP